MYRMMFDNVEDMPVDHIKKIVKSGYALVLPETQDCYTEYLISKSNIIVKEPTGVVRYATHTEAILAFIEDANDYVFPLTVTVMSMDELPVEVIRAYYNVNRITE